MNFYRSFFDKMKLEEELAKQEKGIRNRNRRISYNKKNFFDLSLIDYFNLLSHNLEDCTMIKSILKNFVQYIVVILNNKDFLFRE